MTEWLLALRLALALLLYAFLGVTLYTLWRDLRKEEPLPLALTTPAALRMETGTLTGQCTPLRPVTALGRAEDNTLVLQDPFASAHHTLVLWRDGQWWIEDLGSHNGTYLNGARLVVAQPLTTGDLIRIGETVLRFTIEAQTN